MEDLLRKSFASPFAIAAMEPRLLAAGGLDWQIRETPADGPYLRGLTQNGAKVRILSRGTRFLAEIHFPIGKGWTRFSDEDKRAFLAWLSSHVLAAIQASDERDEAG